MISPEVLHLLSTILIWVEWIVIGYFTLVNTYYAVILVTASMEMGRYMLEIRGEAFWRVLASKVAPRISVLAPAYNEATNIQDSVQGLLTLEYPNLEVVLVNDGSSDATMDVLKQAFELRPVHPIYQKRLYTKPIRALYRSELHSNLAVVDKERGGKADALDAALCIATGELVCSIDADTIIEADALARMVRPFLASDDVLAVGGTVRVANGCEIRGGRVVSTRVSRRPLAGFQVIEYLRAFLFGRLGLNYLGGNLIISGAFGLFRRESVLSAGGYAHDTVSEDMELVVRLRRRGYEQKGPHHVRFIPDPVAWTEVPTNLNQLRRQRDRWHRGLAEVLWRHKKMFLNPRYGKLGMLSFPYFVLVELLAPLMEVIGLAGLALGLYLHAVSLEFALLFFALAYGYCVLLSGLSLVLDELSFHRYERVRDRIGLLMWAMLENLGYRQLTTLFRLEGFVRFFLGRRDWGVMERKGFRADARVKP